MKTLARVITHRLAIFKPAYNGIWESPHRAMEHSFSLCSNSDVLRSAYNLQTNIRVYGIRYTIQFHIQVNIDISTTNNVQISETLVSAIHTTHERHSEGADLHQGDIPYPIIYPIPQWFPGSFSTVVLTRGHHGYLWFSHVILQTCILYGAIFVE